MTASADARDRLRNLIQAAGNRLYFVSIPGGNSPRYRAYLATVNVRTETAEMDDATHLCAAVAEARYNERTNTMTVPGTGFDRTQHITEAISSALFGHHRGITKTVL